MNHPVWQKIRRLGLLVALAAGLALVPGCQSLCTKRLYLHRDGPERGAPTALALLLTNPELVRTATPQAPAQLDAGMPWASDLPHYDSEVYRLGLTALDNGPVYQGQCLDTEPTYACEVKPGTRVVRVSLELMGPWGKRTYSEDVRLTLTAGNCTFLRLDWEALMEKRLVVKVEPLADRYTPEVRSRVVEWLRAHTTGAHTLE